MEQQASEYFAPLPPVMFAVAEEDVEAACS